MKVTKDLLDAANSVLAQNQQEMNNEQSIINSIGCFGCGLGCSGTVGG